MMVLLMSFLLMILILSFIVNSKHVIMMLILLESMMMILLTYLFFMLIELNQNPFMYLLILSLSACEAALGLSILVSLMRFKGNDFMSSIVSLQWFAKIYFY